MLGILVGLLYTGPLAYLAYTRKWIPLLYIGGILVLIILASLVIAPLADFVLYIHLVVVALYVVIKLKEKRR